MPTSEEHDQLEMLFRYSNHARRDYFAAHAPEEIPAWFQSEQIPNPPPPKEPSPPTEAYRSAASSLNLAGYGTSFGDIAKREISIAAERFNIHKDSLIRFIEELAEWEQEKDQWRATLDQIEQRNRLIRYFAWRRFYADHLIAVMDYQDEEPSEEEEAPPEIGD